MSTVRKAARSLFGRPDPEMISEQLEHTLKKMYEKDKAKWNFDFEMGIPVENGSGDYHFEPVMTNEVPEFYRERPSRPRKAPKRQASDWSSATSSPTKFFVDDEKPSSKPTFFAFDAPSPSKKEDEETSYQKPVTRSASRLSIRKEGDLNKEDGLKQTKMTNYMRVRKRRSETNLVSMAKSASIEFFENDEILNEKSIKESEPNSKLSSLSDTTLVVSPRSPPHKRCLRSRRATAAAGDC